MSKHQNVTEEQIAYAKILDLGMKAGLLLLIISFSLYVFGILTPHIPLEDLPKYWKLPVNEYLKQTGIHTGWSWLHLLGQGDFLNFVGIAFLAGVSIICYLRVIPSLFRKGDTIYAFLAIAEVVVLVLAASGVLKAGGH
jgi:phosphoglycerol transferase MdoB-like AlkP superfamily enzyme